MSKQGINLRSVVPRVMAYRRLLLWTLAVAYMLWMAYFWVFEQALVLSYTEPFLVNSSYFIYFQAAQWFLPPLLAYILVRMERADRSLVSGRKFRIALLSGLSLVMLVVLVTFPLGVNAALGVMMLSLIMVMISARRVGSVNAAFTVLTLFVLSIVAFSAAPLFISLSVLPFHAFAAGAFLWLQRDVLRSDPARLRRLVWLGIALSVLMVAAHVSSAFINAVGFIGGVLVPEFYGTYTYVYVPGTLAANEFLFPIPFILLMAGVLLALSGRVSRRVYLPLFGLAVAALAAWYLLALPAVLDSGQTF